MKRWSNILSQHLQMNMNASVWAKSRSQDPIPWRETNKLIRIQPTRIFEYGVTFWWFALLPEVSKNVAWIRCTPKDLLNSIEIKFSRRQSSWIFGFRLQTCQIQSQILTQYSWRAETDIFTDGVFFRFKLQIISLDGVLEHKEIMIRPRHVLEYL